MSRFVVLEHTDSAGMHWDFMLEAGPVLKTWALKQPPDSSQPVVAEALPDHRPAYLDYEGPISGDRGSVTRWDRGTYRMVKQSEGELTVELAGEKLKGEYRISNEEFRRVNVKA